jgi:hypothetical protein
MINRLASRIRACQDSEEDEDTGLSSEEDIFLGGGSGKTNSPILGLTEFPVKVGFPFDGFMQEDIRNRMMSTSCNS